MCEHGVFIQYIAIFSGSAYYPHGAMPAGVPSHPSRGYAPHGVPPSGYTGYPPNTYPSGHHPAQVEVS